MKTLLYVLATVLFITSLSIIAEPLKKVVIGHPQAANPDAEGRPAATTNQK